MSSDVRSFASDNFSGVHPEYLDAIAGANAGHAMAYGGDSFTKKSRDLFADLCGQQVDVLYTFNGTGANVVALSCLMGRAESVLCTEWAHIHVDETGAPERILGAKLADVASSDAKLRPSDIHAAATALGNVHHVQPGVVSITQSTELGTMYTVGEIAAICDAAHSHGMRVHLDGARLSNAVAASGLGADGFRAMTFGAGVDAVCFGGTKNGMLNAEVVLLRPGAADGRAEWLRKQATQLPSKMRFTAAQFVRALESGLWLETAAHANAMTSRLYAELSDISTLDLVHPVVNSLYPTIPQPVRGRLQAETFFWDWDVSRDQARWMTSWDTTVADVESFASKVRSALTESQ